MHIDDDRLRVATLEFLVKVLVTSKVRDTSLADLKHEVLSALERISPQCASDEVERAEIRARMHAEADAILRWAAGGGANTMSPIEARPLSVSHYRQWR